MAIRLDGPVAPTLPPNLPPLDSDLVPAAPGDSPTPQPIDGIDKNERPTAGVQAPPPWTPVERDAACAKLETKNAIEVLQEAAAHTGGLIDLARGLRQARGISLPEF